MNRFKELMKDKKMTAGIIAAAAVVLCAAGAVSLKGCAGEEEARADAKQTESTTATDLMAVTLKDRNGKNYVVEGVAVTDESGKTTITVTDGEGNETVIVGEVSEDRSGKKTVSNAAVISGGRLTTSDGTVVDTSESEVGDIKDNNSGGIKTDVSVSEDKKNEVESKREEASKETQKATQVAAEDKTDKVTTAETKTQASEDETAANTGAGGSSSGNTAAATQAQTEAAKPEAPKPTQAATQAPKPTQAATEAPKPTEAVTSRPLTKEEQIIADCEYKVKGEYIFITDYNGTEENLVIPTSIDGKPVKRFSISGNKYVKSITFPDGYIQESRTVINSCDNLETINFGRGITHVYPCTIQYCPKLKEINMYGAVTNIERKWCAGSLASGPYFKGAVLNIYNNPANVELHKSGTADLWIEAGKILDKFNLKNGLADVDTEMFREINFIY